MDNKEKKMELMSPSEMNYGPIPVLEDYLKKAVETGIWFDAVVFTAIHVEKYGCDKIRFYLKNLKVNESFIEAILDRISLLTVAKCLQELSIIDKSEKEIIEKLNAERNNFIHRTTGYHAVMGTKGTKKYEPLVREAIQILKKKLSAIRANAFY